MNIEDPLHAEREEQRSLRDGEDRGESRRRPDYDPHGFTYTPCGDGRSCWHWQRGLDCPPDPWADIQILPRDVIDARRKAWIA